MADTLCDYRRGHLLGPVVPRGGSGNGAAGRRGLHMDDVLLIWAGCIDIHEVYPHMSLETIKRIFLIRPFIHRIWSCPQSMLSFSLYQKFPKCSVPTTAVPWVAHSTIPYRRKFNGDRTSPPNQSSRHQMLHHQHPWRACTILH